MYVYVCVREYMWRRGGIDFHLFYVHVYVCIYMCVIFRNRHRSRSRLKDSLSFA